MPNKRQNTRRSFFSHLLLTGEPPVCSMILERACARRHQPADGARVVEPWSSQRDAWTTTYEAGIHQIPPQQHYGPKPGPTAERMTSSQKCLACSLARSLARSSPNFPLPTKTIHSLPPPLILDLRPPHVRAIFLLRNPVPDLVHVPAAHGPLALVGLPLHRLAHLDRVGDGAGAVAPPPHEALVRPEALAGAAAVVERAVRDPLVVVVVLGLLHAVAHPLVPLALRVGLQVEVEAVVGAVVPVLARGDEVRRHVLVVDVPEHERPRQRRVVGGYDAPALALALKVPERVDFFAVHVVHRHDRVAPVRGAEGEGGGFLAVDGRPLFFVSALAFLQKSLAFPKLQGGSKERA
ncbi:hypothetical protein VTK26DRAFT_372 [Humicola hyalothermophila]